MTLQEIIARLNLNLLTSPQNFNAVTPQGGYASDLLSCVVAEAQPGNLWVTLQAHMNVVAVAKSRKECSIVWKPLFARMIRACRARRTRSVRCQSRSK
jgi:hypothetical protein